MDKRGRVTKWEEWEVGAMYVRIKGDETEEFGKLIAVDKERGCVLFERCWNGNGPGKSEVYEWRNLFRKMKPVKALRFNDIFKR